MKLSLIHIYNNDGFADEALGLLRDVKDPVSYTHLDVYKRQVIDINGDLYMVSLSSGSVDSYSENQLERAW